MLRKVNLGHINPLTLNEDEKKYLAVFFQQHSKFIYFTKNKTYSFLFQHDHAEKFSCYAFKFTHDILVRERKESKNSNEHRFQVIANQNELGRGGQGVVILSVGILKQANRAMLFKPRPRAIKRIDWNPDHPREDNIAIARNEYANSIKATHLHVKPISVNTLESKLTKTRPSAYMTIKFMPGKNLTYYIDEEIAGRLHLTTDQRIQLSIDLLKTVKTQAHDAGLIHRDLKSENFMLSIPLIVDKEPPLGPTEVDLFPEAEPHKTINAQDPRDVNLVDFSFSKIINDPDSDPGPSGSMITMPMEQFFCCAEDVPQYSVKADSYSSGKTLAELWWAESEAMKLLDDEKLSDMQAYVRFFRYAQNNTNFDFTNFLADDLSNEHAARIKRLLMKLTRAHPNDRLAIDSAITELAYIQEKRKAPGPAKCQLGF